MLVKKQLSLKKKKVIKVTLSDLFKEAEKVALKAKKDASSKKLIDSAAQKWESDSRYAF